MKKKNTVFKTFSLISQLGISVITPVVICTLIGLKLEEKFSFPITIPLIILGILAGGRNAYALVAQVIREMAAEKDEDE